jgi:hypothetical protein
MNSEIFWKFKDAPKRDSPKKDEEQKEPINLEEEEA